jgi:flagellar biosynthetic protein FliR
MDGPVAIVLDGRQMLELLDAALWPFLRIGAALGIAPLIGSRMVPRRVRFLIAAALALMLAPLLPSGTPPELLTAEWYSAIARELVAGLALGFMLQLAFEATAVAGELISQGMGLSFAQMSDPIRGGSAAVVGQMLLVVGGLVFFAAGLHLSLVQLLAESFSVVPPGSAPALGSYGPDLVAFAGRTIALGVQLALPLVIALLVVNLVFGFLSRTAPALNPMAVGFPATLFVGLSLLVLVIPAFAVPFVELVREALGAAGAWFGAHG